MFRLIGRCDRFYLDCILVTGDQLLESVGRFKYLGIEDLPQELLNENSSINVELLENKTQEKLQLGRNCYLLQLVCRKLKVVIYLLLTIISWA